MKARFIIYSIVFSICTMTVLSGCSSVHPKESNEMINESQGKTSTTYSEQEENVLTKTDNTSVENDKGKRIIGEVSGEFSWALDPADPNNLMMDGAVPAKVRVISKNNALFLDDNYLLDPVTPYEVELLEDISATGLNDIRVIYSAGGAVSVSDLMKVADRDTIKKMELDNVPESERDNCFIDYTSEYDYDLMPGNEYIVIMNKSPENNQYYISCYGYGVFEKNDDGDYINVLTHRSFEFK